MTPAQILKLARTRATAGAHTLVVVPDAVALTGIPENTLYSWVHRGRITTHRDRCGVLRVDLVDIAEALEAPMRLHRDIAPLAREARRQGWTVTHAKSGHVHFRSPSGRLVSCSHTPGTRNASQQVRADLRRAGLRLP